MYDYREAVKNDVKEAIEEIYNTKAYKDREEFENALNEELFTCDSVTGNASGSYSFNRWEAQTYVTENMNLLREMLLDFGYDAASVGQWFLDEEYEFMDVLIRCYCLGEAITAALDEMDIEYGEDDDE